MLIQSPIDGKMVSARRRMIWDSVSITAASTGESSLFSDSSSKTDLEMDPLINGRLPNNQRMLVQAMMVAFPDDYDLGDDTGVLDEATISLIINDNNVEKEKLEGHPRNFPAGGGIAGVFDSGDATGNINQQNFNNGLPTPQAIYFIDDMPLPIEEQVTFEVVIDIPTAIGGLTTGRWYVYLLGQYEFVAPGQ